ncbi:hypothetical protein C1H46_038889 [Malus baccata]|uniref:Autophagy-related protein n=1 Tax=Malus baccata TaxID=106549 RepID=A0A540KNK6_MALBA|nr:hypothetical protein C1H46_038889 [Malus baccata]
MLVGKSGRFRFQGGLVCWTPGTIMHAGITRGLYTPVFLNAWELRAREPDHIPVSVEKDASSDIPDIDMTKYNVHRDMPLKEFVDFIRLRIQHDFPWKKSMFVYFKNTEPPIGTKTGGFESPTVEKKKEAGPAEEL